MPSWVLLTFGLICAALMGFAIQRGSTCIVAAVEEIVANRRASRLAAILEAGLWVASGLTIAKLFGALEMAPASVSISGATLIGGAILGLGALINRACLFGTIAKFGSGNWAYALTPLGFYLGCLMIAPHAGHPPNHAIPFVLSSAGSLAILPFIPFVVWRGCEAVRAMRAGRFANHIWAPHQATIVIGLAFLAMSLTVRMWAYSDILIELAAGKVSGIATKLILFLALLGGAIGGGLIGGSIRLAMPTPESVVRCLVGGMLMGAGGKLVPGGNDSLTLIGLPLLLPHAWAALTSMALAIFSGMKVERILKTQ
jgi:Sulphur transport